MPVLTIGREAARRFLVRRHFLAPPRALPATPASIWTVVDRIGSLQFDPLEVAGRNHDLVLLARIDGYRRAWTDALLYEERSLYETLNKGLSLVPTSELPWYRITWDKHRAEHEETSFREHADLVEELLDRIRRDGPISSTDIEPRTAIDWYWRPTNPVRAMLEALGEAGILGLARGRAIAGSTTSPSGCSQRSCWRSAASPMRNAATNCCRATAPTACSARVVVSRRSGPGPARPPRYETATGQSCSRRA